MPQRRWHQFIADVRGFLASGFDEQAQALGWTAADLYGCDDQRPFARIDRMGLLWLLDGNRLVALTPDTAVVETAASRLTFRKKQHSPGRIVLPFAIRSSAHYPATTARTAWAVKRAGSELEDHTSRCELDRKTLIIIDCWRGKPRRLHNL